MVAHAKVQSPQGTRTVWKTNKSQFGTFKIFSSQPFPSSEASDTNQICNFSKTPAALAKLPLGPFQNYSEFAFAKLAFTNTPGSISFAFFDRISQELLADPLVDLGHLKNIKIARLHSKVDGWKPLETILAVAEQSALDDGFQENLWRYSNVSFNVPLGRQFLPGHLTYTGDKMVHRSLLQTIAMKVKHDRFFSPTALVPHKHFVTTSKGTERLYDHPMNCDQMLKYYEELKLKMSGDNMDSEWCVLGLHLWSDSTRLANFGSHKLWPIYSCFAHTPNWAKYQSSSDAWFDIAYIPEVSQSSLN